MPLSRAADIPLQHIARLAAEVPTPFYVYDEALIRQNCRRLLAAFAWNAGFREYFAVKANPNPHIVKLLIEEGCGVDCSSVAELHLAERLGLLDERVFFSSNNTTAKEFDAAAELGAIINLDDPGLIGRMIEAGGPPPMAALRFCPDVGTDHGNTIIGTSDQSKFGCLQAQLIDGIQQLQRAGVGRIGLHTMAVSNELRIESFDQTARRMFRLALAVLEQTGCRCSFINLGGGVGIPYRPDEKAVSFAELGQVVQRAYVEVIANSPLNPLPLYMENGRVMTGPFGWLVTKVISKKQTYKRFVGVDACMANLMRPAMYGAYHHLAVLDRPDAPATTLYDVVGSLCENNDKFAIDRSLPELAIGDTLIIHDAGAHGSAMGFQYNGRLRCAEYLIDAQANAKCIRRAETLDDYFATIDWPAAP